MNYAEAFVSGLLLTLVVGALSTFAVTLFSQGRYNRAIGFYVALGFALGQFSYAGPVIAKAAVTASSAIGSAVALACLWFWHFKRSQIDNSKNGD